MPVTRPAIHPEFERRAAVRLRTARRGERCRTRRALLDTAEGASGLRGTRMRGSFSPVAKCRAERPSVTKSLRGTIPSTLRNWGVNHTDLPVGG